MSRLHSCGRLGVLQIRFNHPDLASTDPQDASQVRHHLRVYPLQVWAAARAAGGLPCRGHGAGLGAATMGGAGTAACGRLLAGHHWGRHLWGVLLVLLGPWRHVWCSVSDRPLVMVSCHVPWCRHTAA